MIFKNRFKTNIINKNIIYVTLLLVLICTFGIGHSLIHSTISMSGKAHFIGSNYVNTDNGYVYRFGSNEVSNGDASSSIGTVYRLSSIAMNTFQHHLYIRHNLVNSTVNDSSLGFVYKGVDYTLSGGTAGSDSKFSSDKAYLDTIFDSTLCAENGAYGSLRAYICKDEEESIEVGVYRNGDIYVSDEAVVIEPVEGQSGSYVTCYKNYQGQTVCVSGAWVSGGAIVNPIPGRANCSLNSDSSSYCYVNPELDYYIYRSSTTSVPIGTSIENVGDYYSTPEKAMQAIDRNFFIRNRVEYGEVTESYIGIKHNNNIYYLRGLIDESSSSTSPIFDENKNVLQSIGTPVYEMNNEENYTYTSFYIDTLEEHISITKKGNIRVFYSNYYCRNSSNTSNCNVGTGGAIMVSPDDPDSP